MDSLLSFHDVVSKNGMLYVVIDSIDEISECGIHKWRALRCY